MQFAYGMWFTAFAPFWNLLILASVYKTALKETKMAQSAYGK